MTYMKRLTGPFINDPAICQHSETRWVWQEIEDWWTGEMVEERVEKWECWDEDIDVHRFQCTHCGRIGYYSGAARQYYEEGIRSPGITGLE